MPKIIDSGLGGHLRAVDRRSSPGSRPAPVSVQRVIVEADRQAEADHRQDQRGRAGASADRPPAAVAWPSVAGGRWPAARAPPPRCAAFPPRDAPPCGRRAAASAWPGLAGHAAPRPVRPTRPPGPASLRSCRGLPGAPPGPGWPGWPSQAGLEGLDRRGAGGRGLVAGRACRSRRSSGWRCRARPWRCPWTGPSSPRRSARSSCPDSTL